MAKNWYVIHTQTGYEDRVKAILDGKIKTGLAKDTIAQVLVPIEQVSEVKAGKKRISQRKFFPGYILVEMELSDETWYLIKSIPGVTGFVGAGSRPLPLQVSEIEMILKQAKDAKEKPTPKVLEWERIVQEMRLTSERVVRGGQSQDAAVRQLDARVDALLEKRRWVEARRTASTEAAP